MKVILVTGGTGFIGSHLCTALLKQGHRVLCVDNNSTGCMDNISECLKHDHFEFMRHDITEPLQVEVDLIYHLACPASPHAYQLNPIKTLKTNVLGTMHMLGLAKRTGARILLTSTSEVYGDPLETPQKETYWGHVNSFGERSCYDEGKRCAESFMYAYEKYCGVDIRIARIFNTYGPHLHKNDGRVVSTFIMQALQGHPITLFGDGQQTRSFCYVEDTVTGLVALMASEDVHGPVNIGNPQEITIAKLARLVVMLTDSSSTLIKKQLPPDDPKRRCPDISKARRVLGWAPTMDLKAGLLHTIYYFKTKYVQEYPKTIFKPSKN